MWLNGVNKVVISMLTVFKHLFKRPVTLEYPEKKKEVNEFFRGKPVVKNCIGCTTCIKVCPSGAIKIEDGYFKIDLKKCIFCGNCAYYCPKGSIRMSDEYELATEDRDDLELIYKLKEEE